MPDEMIKKENISSKLVSSRDIVQLQKRTQIKCELITSILRVSSGDELQHIITQTLGFIQETRQTVKYKSNMYNKLSIFLNS